MRGKRRPAGGSPRGARMFGAREVVWELLTGAALAVGFVTGAPALGPLGVFEVFAIVGTLFWGFGFMIGELVKVRMSRVLAAGALCGASIVAVLGWVALIGAWGLALAVALGVSRPGLPSWLRDRRHKAVWRSILGGFELPDPTANGATSMAAVGGSVDTVTATPPASLDDASLLRAWDDSWVALRRAATRLDALRVVQFRSECLDELERRDPAGIREWLAAGAPHSSEPARHLPPRLGIRRASRESE